MIWCFKFEIWWLCGQILTSLGKLLISLAKRIFYRVVQAIYKFFNRPAIWLNRIKYFVGHPGAKL